VAAVRCSGWVTWSAAWTRRLVLTSAPLIKWWRVPSRLLSSPRQSPKSQVTHTLPARGLWRRTCIYRVIEWGRLEVTFVACGEIWWMNGGEIQSRGSQILY
jgi:hypothetical protein